MITEAHTFKDYSPRVRDELAWFDLAQLRSELGVNRKGTWDNYKDNYGMPDLEGNPESHGSVAWLRNNVRHGMMDYPYDGTDPDMVLVNMEYVDCQSLLSYAVRPGGDWTTTFDDSTGAEVTYSSAQWIQWAFSLCMYCKVLARMFEVRMKINQTGTGGRGGLMINYPH